MPTLLSFYGIPFTGPDETAMCIALDKTLTKQMLCSHSIKTSDYIVVSSGALPHGAVKYPAIVKPNAEGSSKGIREKCVVRNAQELHALLRGISVKMKGR